MNIEELREYCISLKAVTEHFPFDEVTLVFKVKDKMFALIPLDNPQAQIALKCDPDRAIELREQNTSIIPAWHFNKKYWNTVIISPEISTDLLTELIQHSYKLVVSGLPKKVKDELKTPCNQAI
jgi:predicted DNA-binding protein (MmcQ/YjbR family)